MFHSVVEISQWIYPVEIMSLCFQLYKLNERYHMSKNEHRFGVFIINHREDDFGDHALHYCQDLMCDLSGKESKTKEKIMELLKYRGYFDVLETVQRMGPPQVPCKWNNITWSRSTERTISFRCIERSKEEMEREPLYFHWTGIN